MAEAMSAESADQASGPAGGSDCASLYVAPQALRQSPFGTGLTPGRRGVGDGTPGVLITPIVNSLILGLSVRASHRDALDRALRDVIGYGLPDDRSTVALGDGRLAWDGPHRYRLVLPTSEVAKAEQVANAARAHAAVVDQSHGSAVLQIAGPKVMDVLAKGTSMESARVFPVGAVALTSLGHLPVHLTHVDDTPTVEIATFRSMAEDLAEWLTGAGAMYGLVVREARALGAAI